MKKYPNLTGKKLKNLIKIAYANVAQSVVHRLGKTKNGKFQHLKNNKI